MKVGVLALQGAVTPHLQKIEALGATAVRVTTEAHLRNCDALIVPGGESTTMLKLIASNHLFDPLQAFFRTKPVWGTCAGAILLAAEVINPPQQSFAAIQVRAERNAYGSQLDSFTTDVLFSPLNKHITVDFIRAPKIYPLSQSVEVLASHNGTAVCCREGNIVVSTFHTELGASNDMHAWLIEDYFQSF